MTRHRSILHEALFVGLLCAVAPGQTTVRVSVDSIGAQGNGASRSPFISADGRRVVFHSFATNLVPGDTNGFPDVFVHDRTTGAMVRASVASNGAEGNFSSVYGSISADGRYVAFMSLASNLVVGDVNGFSDVFVHDLQNGTTSLVSVSTAGVPGDMDSENPKISADGRFVVFQSSASTLVPGDSNSVSDTFVRDLQSGVTSRVSVSSSGVEANSDSTVASISADGRYVAFGSAASNLVVGDTNGFRDIFVRDRLAGTTVRASVDSNGAQANSLSVDCAISADGSCVAFASYASNLVAGDSNVASDVFVRDLVNGTTQRVSVDSNGAQGDASGSAAPTISSDGRFVAFSSNSTNLVAADTNGSYDVFLHDRVNGATTRVSVGPAGAQANGGSGLFGTWISEDGRCIAFESNATNLVSGDTNAAFDIFVHDRGPASAFTPQCFGDGSGVACPCANSGSVGHGCDNSNASGGALLTATGQASLAADSVHLTSANELRSALSIVLQGSAVSAPIAFGDGLRCTGGMLLWLYSRNAVGGVITAPAGAEPSISARSFALGHPILSGSTRQYQVYYRDANASFCPAPAGSTFNVSNAIVIAWGA